MGTTSVYDKEEPFRYPLGLPSGSVRALLTLMVVGVICFDIVKHQAVEIVWAETLMIALAHYFTTRRFVNLPPEVLAKLEADGVLQKEPYPLYLPRGSIRAVILASFIGVAVYEFQQGRLWEPAIVSILGALVAYFVGNLIRSVRDWWYRGRSLPPTRLWGDIKAITCLGGLLLISLLRITQHQNLLPAHSEAVVMALTLFYFGSR